MKECLFEAVKEKQQVDHCVPDEYGRCLTCSDEALPLTVLEIDDLGWTAVVQTQTGPSEIDISLVEGVVVGSVVMVHGGVALGMVVNSDW